MGHKPTSTPKSFYIRLGLFIISFLIITGILGPYIVSSRLLYGFHFFIYGNLGKLVLLSSFAFFLLLYNKVIIVQSSWFGVRSRWKDGIFIALGILCIPLFYLSARELLFYQNFNDNILLSLLAHLLLIAIPTFFVLAIFTPTFLYRFTRTYWKLLSICLGVGIFYDISIFFIWKLWPYLSNMILQIMYSLFSLTTSPVVSIPPRTLFVKNFAVEIGEACSGIESIYMLMTLYSLILFFDWQQLDKKKALLVIIPLFIGAFIVNIIRVYTLILTGLIFSPQIMYELFHTYLGLIFFLSYFVAFLYFVYPKLRSSQ